MIKKSYWMIAIAIVAIVILAACQRTASSSPLAATPTSAGVFSPATNGNSAATPTNLNGLGTQTALAQTVEAGPGGVTPTPLTPQPNPTSTQIGGASLPPTATIGPSPIATVVRAAVPTIVITRPTTYELKAGEYPYCIARRFNLDPQGLMAANGLTSAETFYPGLKLTIPQTGTFPGNRSLHPHPATFTVTSTEDTIYKIACYYGDLDPSQIIATNNLASPYTLHVSQSLTIP
jgi:LysM repeat protein